MAQDVAHGSARPLKTSSQQERLTLFAELDGGSNEPATSRAKLLTLGTETEVLSALNWMLRTEHPCPAERLITYLRALAVTHPMQELSEAEASLKFRIFCEDIGHIPERIIAEACRLYRRNPVNTFFPTPGKLLEICEPMMNARNVQRRGAERMRQSLFMQDAPAIRVRRPPPFRPGSWWLLPKDEWPDDWQEREVPSGYRIRDTKKGRLRDPIRAV